MGKQRKGPGISSEDRDNGVTTFKYKDQPPDPDRNFFGVRIGSVMFGFVFVTPEARTFVWYGSIDFASVQEEALVVLPKRIAEVEDFSPLSEEDYNVDATVVLSGRGQVKHFDLDSDVQSEEYKELMANPSEVFHIGYDVEGSRGFLKEGFSFTAENPELREAYMSELAVQLPRLPGIQTCSPSLAQWMIEHHNLGFLMPPVKPEELAETLSKVGT